MFDGMQNIPGWLAVIISATVFVYTVIDGRGKKAAQKIRDLDSKVAGKADALDVSHIAEKLDRVEDRMTTIEGEIKHLPDKDTAHSIELRVSDLSGQVGALAEQLKPVTAMASRIQEALIEQVKFK